MIVGTMLAKWDRPSFDDWFPRNLEEQFELCDYLHVRVDRETADKVTPFFEPYGDWISWELQEEGRFQEDTERQALLTWALESGATWCYCSDADEVLEPGAGKVLRDYVLRNRAGARVYRLWLSYSSHHRKGFLLPRTTPAFRFFKLDHHARAFAFEADEDGLHCGTVPWPHEGCRTIKSIHLLHFHACTPEEYLGERKFYEGGAEVRKWGESQGLTPQESIDRLYACGRFGNEAEAYPESDLALDREERYARLAR